MTHPSFYEQNMNVKPTKYDFDDILIEPKSITDIYSRYSDIELPYKLPLFTAPMDTVVDLSNIREYLREGVNVTLPRTIKHEDFVRFHEDVDIDMCRIFYGIGLQDLEEQIENNLDGFFKDEHILIDVANGHMDKIVKYCKIIKKIRPDIVIMVGNIANPLTYRIYAENQCVDYIRIGIGNGGGCLTTKQSGVGFPMASLIHETYKVKEELQSMKIDNLPMIVADGGMKDYSDVVKALALGADYVMIGSIFNKALESCADNYFMGVRVTYKTANWLFNHGIKTKKHFRGMSTKEAQKAMGKTAYKTSEGVVRYRRVEYHLDGWLHNFKHYLRNAMSYNGSRNLQEFIGKANIIQITSKAYDRFNK